MSNVKYQLPSLPISWYVRKNNIEIGDSLFKEAHSGIIVFYKNKNGVSKKYCEIDIKEDY